MSKSKKQPKTIAPALGVQKVPLGNHISEWLGHRIFPDVKLDVAAFTAKDFGTCPFLTEALHRTTQCIKNENSFGVCTVSSYSNGPLQDWLVCPYRVIASDLVRQACGRIFGITKSIARPVPVTILKDQPELNKFKKSVRENGVGFVFFQDKLGGEISVLATPRSPEMAFDVTLVEILFSEDAFRIGRYGILEIQTMDFHGSYGRAVSNLRDALRLHKKQFASELRKNTRWAGEKIEGPNIANVFKRTFYQILLKFQLSGKGAAAGTVLAIPQSVWDSWQPFLGAPELEQAGDGALRLRVSDDVPVSGSTNAYVCIFDLNGNANTSISPIEIKNYIRVAADELAHHAFKVVPAGMMKSISEKDSILVRIRTRMAEWWPDIVATP